MRKLPYRELSGSIRSAIPGGRVPLYGMIEVTRRCPLRCAHCYNNLPISDRDAAARELTLAEHCNLIDEVAAAGCLWLTFTGGEIFAREDFLEIYEHAVGRGLLVTLFTNGVLITPETAGLLAGLPPHSIEISVYGVTAQTHDRVTGVPGSHARCMRAVRVLLEHGLPLGLKSVVMSLNEHELWPLKRFVEEELGVKFRFDPMIVPRLDRSPAPLALRLAPARVVEMEQRDPMLRSEWRRFSAACADGPPTRGEVYWCNAGVTGFGVDPCGGLNVCLFSPGGKYDLRTGSFRDGWEGALLRERRRKVTRRTRCTGCSLRPLCGMCPPNSELERDDPEEPVEYFCEVAHRRARALGLAVLPHGECVHCASPAPPGLGPAAAVVDCGRESYS